MNRLYFLIIVDNYYFYFVMNDKKLILAFRGFVEKVFLPNLKKNDQAYLQWSKFNQILSQEPYAADEILQYVDSLGNNNSGSMQSFDKR